MSRTGGVLLVVALASSSIVRLAAPVVRRALGDLLAPDLEPARVLASLVTLTAAGALVLVAVWVALATTWCVVLALRTGAGGVATRVHPLLRPALVRVLAAAALGSGALAAPAAAVSSAPAPPSTAHRAAPGVSGLPQALAGLPLPDRPTGRSTTAHAGGSTLHTVVACDSLWGIAADHLPRGAPPALVDRSWRAVYDANRRVIGDDPHLIRPGTALRLPVPLT